MRGFSLSVAVLTLAACAPQHRAPSSRPVSANPPPVRANAIFPTPQRTAVPAPARAGRVSDSLIQIGIVRHTNRITLRTEARFAAVDQKNGETIELQPSVDYLLLAGPGRGLSLGPYQFERQFRLISAGPGGFVRLGPKRYRGSLLVRAAGDATFTIVNEVGLEEYIEGVLPAEMSPEWPFEALKAQAVVARTFALANLDKFRAQGFDFSDDNRSQAYGDIDRQKPSTDRAVRETQGQVLTWDGKMLRAFFHSCCGGHTCSVGTIWGSMAAAPKPLRGVADRYCAGSPEYQWSAYFTTDDIVAALQKHGSPLSKLQSLRVGQFDRSSGYMKTLNVKMNRNWMGNKDFKSTKVLRIVPKSNGYYFVGKGFGHGVGLCQWGARAMAEKGK